MADLLKQIKMIETYLNTLNLNKHTREELENLILGYMREAEEKAEYIKILKDVIKNHNDLCNGVCRIGVSNLCDDLNRINRICANCPKTFRIEQDLLPPDPKRK